jgi:hypothetical protein
MLINERRTGARDQGHMLMTPSAFSLAAVLPIL